MNAAAIVPVIVEPEAAEYIAKLGYREQFDQMLAKVRELIPDLREIEVKLAPDDEGRPEGGILITAFGARYVPGTCTASNRFYQWKRTAYDLEVEDHFGLLVTAGGNDAG